MSAAPDKSRSKTGVVVGVGRQAWARGKADNVSLVAAGVAFYAMLAIFPAIIGVVSVYALVADPAQIRTQLDPLIRSLPPGGGDLLVNQLTGAINAGHGGITVGLVISLLVTVLAASAGVRALMTGLDVIHRRVESRGFLTVRLLAAGLTLGAMLLAVVVIALVAAFPVALGHLGLGSTGEVLAQVGRWVALVVVAALALAVFYRYGPAGGGGSRRWFTAGILVALLVWMVGSVAFSVYVSNFSHYNKAYGALAAVIVLLLWLYLSAYAVLLGAEVDAVVEHPGDPDGGAETAVGVASVDGGAVFGGESGRGDVFGRGTPDVGGGGERGR
jgi:membrane protein